MGSFVRRTTKYISYAAFVGLAFLVGMFTRETRDSSLKGMFRLENSVAHADVPQTTSGILNVGSCGDGGIACSDGSTCGTGSSGDGDGGGG